MKHILISGLVNTETTVQVRQFPIRYYPIGYPFFGVNTAASGVAYNIAIALNTLGDHVTLLSMTGNDFPAAYIKEDLMVYGIDTSYIRPQLRQTPNSVVLYDAEGKRQVYCDLKDIQEASYSFEKNLLDHVDLVAACNTNFNRELLHLAKAAGKPIATDVHVLSDLHDSYNREFMEYADILFLSDEGIGADYRGFLLELVQTYGSKIIILGRGNNGAAIYQSSDRQIHEQAAVCVGEVVNTVGAGDALFSAFLHYYIQGFSPLDALTRAQLFASAKIRVSGAAKGFVTEDALQAIYERSEERKVL